MTDQQLTQYKQDVSKYAELTEKAVSLHKESLEFGLHVLLECDTDHPLNNVLLKHASTEHGVPKTLSEKATESKAINTIIVNIGISKWQALSIDEKDIMIARVQKKTSIVSIDK